jgi:integrase/recombinase XerD
MGKMRRLLEEELRLRGYRERTIDAYARCVAKFVQFHGRPAQEMGTAEVRAYLLYMTEKQKLAGSTVNQAVCALRFFYVEVLKRSWEVETVRLQRRVRRLPGVLTESEVGKLISAARDVKQRAVLMTLYSAGLRLDELIHLQPADIDSSAMQIRVREGKGGHERYTLLSKTLLEALRIYYKLYRPDRWLFCGCTKDQPIAARSVQRMIAATGKRAGLTKPIRPHMLRHSFATHLLEGGTALPYIKELLGHRSLRSTLIYTHVSREGLGRVVSPLDRISLPLADLRS